MASKLRLSASRIKTYENCSWLYYCNYILKLPQSSNDGSNRGDTVHRVLECLAKTHRRELVKSLLEDIYSSPAINRMVKIIAKKNRVADKTNLETIYKFLYTGLKADFYSDAEGGLIQPPEYAFDIGDPEIDGYNAIGFIDKYIVFPDKKFISIVDYKTSKTAFSKAELENNVQAMMYSLALHKKYPEFDSSVRFLFLKFPKNPIRDTSYNKKQLAGFEEYLRSVYAEMSKFDYNAAQSNYAYEGGFSKSWLCGKAVYPGQLKEDGVTPHWYCSHKFPYTYYAIVDEFGNNLRTALKVSDLNAKAGESVMKKHYPGCKFWEKKLKFK